MENGEIYIDALHNRANHQGGAVYLTNGIINIGTRATVVLCTTELLMEEEQHVWCMDLCVLVFGQWCSLPSTVLQVVEKQVHTSFVASDVKSTANIRFSRNSTYSGGAVFCVHARPNIEAYASVLFLNNTGTLISFHIWRWCLTLQQCTVPSRSHGSFNF